MKKPLEVVFAALLFVSLGYSQSGGSSPAYVLTGAVTSVQAIPNSATSGTPLFSYRLTVSLQFRNDSNRHLIIFDPRTLVLARRIVFLDNVYTVHAANTSTQPRPWIRPWTEEPYRSLRVNPFSGIVLSLDRPRPIGNPLIVIEPGQYYEYIDRFTIEDGYSLQVRGGQSLADAAGNSPAAEYPAFFAEYHLSLKKQQKGDDLLKMLRDRWKPLGHFPVDSGGDYFVRSEVILNPPAP